MRDQLLDCYGVDYAILTGGDAIEVSTLANHHYAAALARAYNDWMIDSWLSNDSRFRGSVLVAPQDPEAAAAEIRRVGVHPDIVQVLLSSHSQRPYGDPFHQPIWEAAAELDLPVAIHFGGTGGINTSPFASGMPTFYYEYHALVCEAAMTHLASVICQGVFVKFPNARFVIVECGVAWLPGVLWRLDANYRALRKETPWLKMLPSEYARQYVRLTTQPLEQASDRRKLWDVLGAFDGEHVLMFASDYPHWDFDNPTMVDIPPAWRDNVMDRNARELYGFPRTSETTRAD